MVINNIPNLKVTNLNDDFQAIIIPESYIDGISIHKLKVTSKISKPPKPITVTWKIPSNNIKGVWNPSIFRENRILYDWELTNLESRISVNAPIISVYGHNDENRTTLAISDAVNKIQLNARLREEDNCLYFNLLFFAEPNLGITNYETEIRIDTRNISFSKAIKDTSIWWEDFENLKPIPVPNYAKKPFYCTWYQFHQNLEVDKLLEECKLAKELGCESIIIDDGWQTLDSNRGYDFVGDWEPERIPNMKDFVKSIHEIGLKIILWYSVPFCGIKTKAYKKFKGKFLTENHRWAPVFDPRYPDVRAYLTNIYKKAITEWHLDGFKLDFIDDLKVYESTEFTLKEGMDCTSVDQGTEKLLANITESLLHINPNVAIEFRQQYNGPAMRRFGNMFRSFDCPTDSNTNRVRTTDVKMLCGTSAVHSDPLTWNYNENVEIAALQLLSSMFTVPQISVNIGLLPQEHYKMLKFYLGFWKKHSDILLNHSFTPYRPLMGYPILTAHNDSTLIAGIYDMLILEIEQLFNHIHIINASSNDYVVINTKENYNNCNIISWNCEGEKISEEAKNIPKGITKLEVPKSGLIEIENI